ncbi:hypothetical protein F4806DRAFT_49094 [Annulohypoxylon nitens]|nr:hypothetical protein F4806DRAFT_49094 [Annulohypoxylon nitens]
MPCLFFHHIFVLVRSSRLTSSLLVRFKALSPGLLSSTAVEYALHTLPVDIVSLIRRCHSLAVFSCHCPPRVQLPPPRGGTRPASHPGILLIAPASSRPILFPSSNQLWYPCCEVHLGLLSFCPRTPPSLRVCSDFPHLIPHKLLTQPFPSSSPEQPHFPRSVYPSFPAPHSLTSHA